MNDAIAILLAGVSGSCFLAAFWGVMFESATLEESLCFVAGGVVAFFQSMESWQC